LHWSWIVTQAIVPSLIGALVAWPFWRKEQPIFGNIAGSIVMFGWAFALILREHAEIDAAVRACFDEGTVCWPEPAAFTRFVIYASVGLAEVIALFTISLHVEAKLRRRGYDPQWR
jgi:hypothetical protein